MNLVYFSLICALSPFQGPATSSVILKFELIYIPTLGNGWCVCYCVKYTCVHPEFYSPHSSTLISCFLLHHRTEVQDSSDDTDLIPVHEFRIPHRALLGLHSYCPVHFDALHSALVDLTIHIVYLKAAVTKSSSLKVHRFVILYIFRYFFHYNAFVMLL